MVTGIYNTLTKCSTCAQNWLSLRRHTSPLTLFPANKPLTDLSVDIFGPIPATKAGNRFILVTTDRFFKLSKCVALRCCSLPNFGRYQAQDKQDRYFTFC